MFVYSAILSEQIKVVILCDTCRLLIFLPVCLSAGFIKHLLTFVKFGKEVTFLLEIIAYVLGLVFGLYKIRFCTPRLV